MFRSFITFLALFILIVVWIYYFTPEKNNSELDTDFSLYLTWALERNTKKYSVIFEESFFEDELQDEDVSNEEFIWNISDTENNIQNTPLAQKSEMIDIKWNYGTPPIPWRELTWMRGNTDMCNGWLIYDPCLVIGEPIEPSGEMNFWSRKYN